MKNTIQILSGPSREELFDGLRLFFEKRTVNFTVENDNGRSKRGLPTIIQCIEPEDGSGDSWNIRFNIPTEDLLRLDYSFFPDNFYDSHVNKKMVGVKAYYSTKSRVGTITIE
ncbi:MAG: hypothetical protein WAV23_02695 [Minisyncoccia bacterium]